MAGVEALLRTAMHLEHIHVPSLGIRTSTVGPKICICELGFNIWMALNLSV